MSEGADRGAEVLAQLERVERIPSLPPVLLRVWDMASKEETSARQLGEVLSQDPGLTGSILRLANSAYFGFPKRVTTVTQAIVVLGFETVKSLAMGASVLHALRPSDGRWIEATGFLRHCLVTASAARVAILRRGAQKSGSAFAAGILHDLGKLVVAEYLPDLAAELAARNEAGDPLDESELGVLGMSHGEVGAWFATRWNLPDELVCSCRWHHEPAAADRHEGYVAAVHVGDVIAHRLGAGESGRHAPPTLDASALGTLGLQEGDLEEITNHVGSQMDPAEPVPLSLG